MLWGGEHEGGVCVVFPTVCVCMFIGRLVRSLMWRKDFWYRQCHVMSFQRLGQGGESQGR